MITEIILAVQLTIMVGTLGFMLYKLREFEKEKTEKEEEIKKVIEQNLDPEITFKKGSSPKILNPVVEDLPDLNIGEEEMDVIAGLLRNDSVIKNIMDMMLNSDSRIIDSIAQRTGLPPMIAREIVIFIMSNFSKIIAPIGLSFLNRKPSPEAKPQPKSSLPQFSF